MKFLLLLFILTINQAASENQPTYEVSNQGMHYKDAAALFMSDILKAPTRLHEKAVFIKIFIYFTYAGLIDDINLLQKIKEIKTDRVNYVRRATNLLFFVSGLDEHMYKLLCNQTYSKESLNKLIELLKETELEKERGNNVK